MTTRSDNRRDYGVLEKEMHDVNIHLVEISTRTQANHESIIRELKTIVSDTDKVTAAVYGNGREGLLTVVAKIASNQKWIWTILAGLIAALGSSFIHLSDGLSN